MMELDELRSATGWTGVFQGRDCPVIRFTPADAHKIRGLGRTDHTYVLNYPEFRDHPISFMVDDGNTTYQYWVIGDALHRPGGPAYVMLQGKDSNSATSVTKWMMNGIRHRTDGPAETLIDNGSYEQDDTETFLIERWEQMTCYWFDFGLPTRFPKPMSALFSEGHRIFRTTSNRKVMHDLGEEPAFRAKTAIFNWTSEQNDVCGFRPRFIIISGYQREYNADTPGLHSCERLEQLHWVLNGDLKEAPREKLDDIATTLFPRWNIWEGPFFEDEQNEMMALSYLIG